jgi:hypothetical protein
MMKYSVALLILITLLVGLLLLAPDNEQPATPLTGLPWQIEL